MNKHFLIKQAHFNRMATLQLVSNMDEETANRIPSAFNNNIRWNLGHILATQEVIMYGKLREQSGIPPVYNQLFAQGTSPKDWKEDPPSLQEITHLLHTQTKQIEQELGDQLHDDRVEPLQIFTHNILTLEEALSFSLWHEGVHYGAIMALKKALAMEMSASS